MPLFKRWVFLICTLLMPTMACASVSQTLAAWEHLRDPDTTNITFEEGYAFLSQSGDWPNEKTIRIRTEAAAFTESPAVKTMVKFCESHPPVSGRGMFACLRANAGTPKQRDEWRKTGWIQGDFTEKEEQSLLNEYGKSLSIDLHEKRLERLLFERKTNAAKRMLARASKEKTAVYRVWMTLQSDPKHTKIALRSLSNAQMRHPGIIYERARVALDAGKLEQLTSLLLSLNATPPYPQRWWPLRQTAIREALNERETKAAQSLIAQAGDLEDEELAELLWIKGWFLLEYRHDAKEAYKAFHALYTHSETPVSRARGAYWAARAAEKNGNKEIAKDWFEKAVKYPTVFYGQLAQASLKPKARLSFPDEPSVFEAKRESFQNDPRVTAYRIVAKRGDDTLKTVFLKHLAASTDDEAWQLQLTQLTQGLDGRSGGVKAAKLALRKRVMLMPYGWPTVPLPNELGVEPALALAITRQESEFNPTARSSANAQGMMQLLPETARQVARKKDIPFNRNTLNDPEDNIRLGTAYLGGIIRGFDGSYILGIASYNAGPANVRKWIRSNGHLPRNVDGAVRWIESIPFAETRNYVMRVLENLQVYRTLREEDGNLTTDLIR